MRGTCCVVVVAVLGVAVHSAAARAATVTVQTAGMPPASPYVFTPSNVTMAVGDTVNVVNGGGVAHTVDWADGAPGFPAMGAPPFPANAMMWSSPRTFSAPGDYAFKCSIHPTTMTGVVHVAAPAPAPPATGTTQSTTTATTTSTTGPADLTAPTFTSTAKATRRAVTLKVRLSESSVVTVVVRRGKRTIARKKFARPLTGRQTLRVPVRTRPGRLIVTITAVDAAGNTARRTFSVRAH